MTSKKPAKKIVIILLGAAVVLCVAGLGLFFLISNLYETSLSSDIISECPFTIAEDAEWKMYSNNNQAGLIALVGEHDGQADRMILVLDKSADKYTSAGTIRSSILYHDYFWITCSGGDNGWHELDEKDIYETSKFIYLRVQYDNRATLTRIQIGTGPSDPAYSGYGEGVSFDFSGPFRVTYYTYSGTETYMYQEYNEKTSGWSMVRTEEYDRLGLDEAE